jgi:hypothetical protein
MRGSDIADHAVVALDHLEPAQVPEPRERGRRVNDVSEHDGDRTVDGARGREIGPLALDRSLELVQRNRQRTAEGLQVGSRE